MKQCHLNPSSQLVITVIFLLIAQLGFDDSPDAAYANPIDLLLEQYMVVKYHFFWWPKNIPCIHSNFANPGGCLYRLRGGHALSDRAPLEEAGHRHMETGFQGDDDVGVI